jgi:hypothetical protein
LFSEKQILLQNPKKLNHAVELIDLAESSSKATAQKGMFGQ